jgi:hypothetical protein
MILCNVVFSYVVGKSSFQNEVYKKAQHFYCAALLNPGTGTKVD